VVGRYADLLPKSGETSSGKTEVRRLAIRALMNLSAAPAGKKGSKLAMQIPSAEYILESLGNCHTLENTNASRFGKYTELQFTETGKLIGAKTLDYYLERSRVVNGNGNANERNFHAFYYLLAGASAEEKEFMRLSDGSNFRYLGSYSRLSKETIRNDASRFNRLKQAFKNVGLSKRQVASICQVLAAILHLGNLEFTQDRQRTQEPATIRNSDVLQTVAGYLGISAKALEESLTYKTKMIKSEVCTILLDTDGASANRDELAKSLYSLLFAWINEYLNEKLCRDSFETFISLLELPGAQNLSRGNSLDQFCVNLANEQLHRFMLRNIFESKTDEYKDEGISHLSPSITYTDNAECIRLLTNQPGGLVHIMDDQARRMPKKTDQTMVEAFGKRWSNHPNFKMGPADRSGFSTFTVSHFHGPVNYTSEGLLEKNSDVVSPDFVSLLRGLTLEESKGKLGTQSPGSTVAFVRALFNTKALQTQAHPKSEQTIVAAQQSVKPLRAPSVRRTNRTGGTIRRGNTLRKGSGKYGGGEKEDDESDDDGGDEGGLTAAEAKKKSDGIRCIAGEFRSALDTLVETLDETKTWFVICLRPNDNQLPNQMEGKTVKEQIKSYCIPEMTLKLINEYSVNMTYEEFCERYASVGVLSAASMYGATGGEAKQKFAAAKDVMSWSDNEASAGRVKVFLSHSAFRELEDELRAADSDEVEANQRKAFMDSDAAARGEVDPFSPSGVLEDLGDMAAGGGVGGGFVGAYGDPFREQSTAVLPLVGNRDDSMDDAKSELTDFSGIGGGRGYLGGMAGSASVVGSEAYAPSRNMFAGGMNEKETAFTAPPLDETTEVAAVSSSRRRWVAITWMCTFWIPTFVLKMCGLERPDIRMAWREKLTINLMIWFVCASAIFVIAVLGNLICPKEHVYSTSEFNAKSSATSLTSIRGEVFDLTNLINTHRSIVSVVPESSLMKYSGVDASGIFPVQVNALCNGVDGTVSPWVQLSNTNASDVNAQYHDFRAVHPEDTRSDWYYESMILMRSNWRKGFMGYTSDGIDDMVADGRSVGIYRGGVYDVTSYVTQGYKGALQAPDGQQVPADTDASFMSNSIIQLINQNPGKDITKRFDALPLSDEVLQRQRVCLRNLYFIGKQDNRNSPACQFSRYILLALSLIMVAIIGFKFLAALQFGRARKPEDHDKFVLCQVPCYTEGEESMRKTIDSLTALKYDDKRKLLFIICDGMIVGSGNDRPTPRIVLDILGADPNLDPEPLSFMSLGEGSKQHNMAKVYSGLYEHHGHVVPYVVVVKCGKPTERQRPGNRGKRDSQLILMRFLNKVHFGSPMNPMELEIYHQIKNVIGVNPSFYEYILQVDADTEVEPLCLNRFISAFTNDKKVIGLCGETSLSNSKKTFITMLQVYEYFISHYLAKAFESLFGSVTCLPGCFSMFRIRTPDTHKPLFVANSVLEDYSENRVDTLHTKNLLHLGEDRYLTTLVLKHFGNYKTIFVRDAKAMTTAPEDLGVLLSQRRRWINSTVHNLYELLSTPGLCGFCLFSMRFIVFIDLLSTIVAPVTMVYLVYLIILVAVDNGTIPVTSLIMLAAIYGLQAIIFLLRRRFDMIIWMLIYIIGLPIWTFFLPLYSFWHMDDFSWGNTRVVMGEKGEKIITHDEGKFHPSEIPQQTWHSYEEELWERNSARSIGSLLMEANTGDDSKSRGGSRAPTNYAPSLYGGNYGGNPFSHRDSPTYGHSPSGSQMGMPSSMMGSQVNLVGGYFNQNPQTPGYESIRRQSTNSLGGDGMMAQQGSRSGYATPTMSMYGMPSYSSQQQMMMAASQSQYGSRANSLYGMQMQQPSPSQQQQQQYYAGSHSGRSTPGGGLDMPLVDTTIRGGYLPADEVIARDIQSIIMSSDLATITKKMIRAQLQEKYQVPISSKKVFINETIDRVLADV